MFFSVQLKSSLKIYTVRKINGSTMYMHISIHFCMCDVIQNGYYVQQRSFGFTVPIRTATFTSYPLMIQNINTVVTKRICNKWLQ